MRRRDRRSRQPRGRSRGRRTRPRLRPPACCHTTGTPASQPTPGCPRVSMAALQGPAPSVRGVGRRVVLLLDGGDGDGLPPPPGAEGDRARLEREQRVVAATTDAQAGVEVAAALTDDDLAGL